MVYKILRKLKIISNFIFSYYEYYKIKNKYSHLLKNEDCFLVGSAPNTDLSLYNSNMKIISVNGSAENINKFNLHPITLTIVDNELIDLNVYLTKESRADIILNEKLKDLDLGLIFSTQSNLATGGSPEILKANFNDYMMINRFVCRLICKKIVKTNLLNKNIYSIPSTGFISIAICFFLGAKSVTLTGFTFYINNKSDTRNHTLSDCALLSHLILNGYKIKSNDVDLLPLLGNWGRNPSSPYLRSKFRNN